MLLIHILCVLLCMQAMLNGTITCTDLVQIYLQRIQAINPIINAVRLINPSLMSDAAEKDVELADAKAIGASLPILFCVPVLVKDNFDAGMF